MKVMSSALESRIQVAIEGMKGVEFSGLDRLKERGPLRFSEEINAIRRCRPIHRALVSRQLLTGRSELDKGQGVRSTLFKRVNRPY
jgi:hypothetical protein